MTAKLVPPRTPDEWMRSGRRVYDDFLAAVARYEIAPDPDLELVPGETPTPYYEHATRTIVLGMPDPAKISGRLHWLMIARMVGAPGVDEAVAHLGTQLPVLVAHEVTHHLRHQYGATTENNFLEEQIANIVAISFVNEDPDLRASLEELEVDAEASVERLSVVSPSTVPQLAGFRPELANILIAQHELSVERLDEVRDLAEELDLPLEEAVIEFGGVSKSELRRALELRERCERYFNQHYLSSFSEYALFFSDWYQAYIDGGHIPSLGDAVERYLLTPEWESVEREASIACLSRAVTRGTGDAGRAGVDVAAEEFGSDAIGVFRVAMATGDGAGRAAAFRACASLDLEDHEITRAAEESLSSRNLDVRAAAAVLVMRSGSPRTRRGKAILDEMIAGDDAARISALRVIAEASPESFAAALIAGLEAADPAERTVALHGIAQLPPSRSLGVLVSARLADPDDVVRREAASALQTHPGDLSLLVAALDDPDWSVRERASEALAHLSPSAKDAAACCRSLGSEVAVTVALSKSAAARRRCGGLLRQLAIRGRALEMASSSVRGESPSARILRAGLADAHDEVRRNLLKLLAARAQNPRVAHALRGLESPEPGRRIAALEAGEEEFAGELAELFRVVDSKGRGRPGRTQIERLMSDDDPELRLLSAGYMAAP